MSLKYTALFVVVAALTALPTLAQAADGCGRGFYYNGSRCVPKHDTDYRPRHRDRGVSVGVGPNMRLHFGEGNNRRTRHYDDRAPRGLSVDLGPNMRLHLGD